MRICKVESKRDLKDFIEFPYQFYKNDPIWVPPLRSEQKNIFKLKTNPFLQHCEWQLFLLKENDKIIGRIAAFIDTLAIDFWKERIGFFGYFECIDNKEASELLLNEVKSWLQKKNCTAMRGPWTFVPQEWGMVIEGFDKSPVLMSPYNPPYYNDLVSAFGLKKVKDLLCWTISIHNGYKFPERVESITSAITKRYGISFRDIDMKDYDNEIKIFLDLSNKSLTQNWGYSPVTEAEVEVMAEDLKKILQPKGVIFAQDKTGKYIGSATALPDINSLIKNLNGKLFPFGFIKVLLGIPKLKRYRMFALGVIPEYQGKAVDALLYKALHENLYSKDLFLEIDYVLEDNWPMINAIKRLEAKESRKYRVYEMPI